MHVLTPDDELDGDDVAGIEALGAQPAGSLPMGIYRRKHQDTGIVVATTAELEAAENATGEEQSLWVEEEEGNDSGSGTPAEAIPEQPPEEGVWGAGRKPIKVKKEPVEDDSAMDLDAVEEHSEKKKKVVEIKVKKAPPLDAEETLARTDLDILASELGSVVITAENGDTRTEDPSVKDGRMYLFQFPPLLPPLQATAPTPRSGTGGVKSEPGEFNMADAPPASSEPVDLTKDNKDDNGEPDKEDPEDKKGFMSSLMSQGGMIGQLKVRKSGKVELDWGGRTLEMSPATNMNFLSTAVILEENDQKPHPEMIGGESIGMGRIMGRFILAPSWDEEEDWEVGSDELRIDDDALLAE
jgi:DNA-directed RNA polymerase III subunit RPC4